RSAAAGAISAIRMPWSRPKKARSPRHRCKSNILFQRVHHAFGSAHYHKTCFALASQPDDRPAVAARPAIEAEAGRACALARAHFRGASMQAEHAVDGAQLRRPDQARMGDRDRMERPLEPFLPEGKKTLKRRKIRTQIVVLPNVRL